MNINENPERQEPEQAPIRRRPGRPLHSEGDSDETRQRIRFTALELFNERGYVSVSIEEIARAANVTRATIYYHYRSKADILLEGVLLIAEMINVEVAQIFNQKELSVQERLKHFVLGRNQEDVTFPGHISEMQVTEAMPHLPISHQRRMTAAFGKTHELVRQVMEEAVESGEFRQIPAIALAHAFWHLFQPSPPPPDMTRQQFEAHLLGIFLRGVLTETK